MIREVDSEHEEKGHQDEETHHNVEDRHASLVGRGRAHTRVNGRVPYVVDQGSNGPSPSAGLSKERRLARRSLAPMSTTAKPQLVLAKPPKLVGRMTVEERKAFAKQIAAKIRAGYDFRARLAIDVMAHRVVTSIGAMTAAAGGLDALVFTGGIGERSAPMRRSVASRLGFLGIALGPANETVSNDDVDVSTPKASTRTLVVHAHEDLELRTRRARCSETDRSREPPLSDWDEQGRAWASPQDFAGSPAMVGTRAGGEAHRHDVRATRLGDHEDLVDRFPDPQLELRAMQTACVLREECVRVRIGLVLHLVGEARNRISVVDVNDDHFETEAVHELQRPLEPPRSARRSLHRNEHSVECLRCACLRWDDEQRLLAPFRNREREMTGRTVADRATRARQSLPRPRLRARSGKATARADRRGRCGTAPKAPPRIPGRCRHRPRKCGPLPRWRPEPGPTPLPC